jgi:hypothetical protein
MRSTISLAIGFALVALSANAEGTVQRKDGESMRQTECKWTWRTQRLAKGRAEAAVVLRPTQTCEPPCQVKRVQDPVAGALEVCTR